MPPPLSDLFSLQREENYAGEFSDSDLNALADAGELYLDESAFFFMPTQKEMQQLAEMGNTLLVVDWFRTL
jgi:hypothetical protein